MAILQQDIDNARNAVKQGFISEQEFEQKYGQSFVPAPSSTVSTPTPQSLPGAPDPTRISGTVDDLGFGPSSPDEYDDFLKATYSDSELKAMGIDAGTRGAARQKFEAASANLLATPQPGTDTLAILEKALKAKSGIGNLPLGESELFGKAGIGGYGALTASLNARMDEMNLKQNSFASVIRETGGALEGAYNQAADKYKMYRDEYKDITDRTTKLLTDIQDHEQAMDLLQKEYDLKIAADDWGNRQITNAQKLQAAELGMVWAGDQLVDADSIEGVFGIGNEQGWCGDYASTISTAPRVGNTWAEKIQKVNKRDNPQPGDKLLLPLGTTDVSGYGHVAVVLGYDAETGDIYVTESNADGRQNRGEGQGIATFGTYNLNDIKSSYGNNWGLVSGQLKPQYSQAIESASKSTNEKPELISELLQRYIAGETQASLNTVINNKPGMSTAGKKKLQTMLDEAIHSPTSFTSTIEFDRLPKVLQSIYKTVFGGESITTDIEKEAPYLTKLKESGKAKDYDAEFADF